MNETHKKVGECLKALENAVPGIEVLLVATHPASTGNSAIISSNVASMKDNPGDVVDAGLRMLHSLRKDQPTIKGVIPKTRIADMPSHLKN